MGEITWFARRSSLLITFALVHILGTIRTTEFFWIAQPLSDIGLALPFRTLSGIPDLNTCICNCSIEDDNCNTVVFLPDSQECKLCRLPLPPAEVSPSGSHPQWASKQTGNWTTLMMIKAGQGLSAYETWTSETASYSEAGFFNWGIISELWQEIIQTRVAMYKGGSLVMRIVFDPKDRTYMDWFSLSKVIAEGTNYTDLYLGQTHNYFSMEGLSDSGVDRRFYISRNHGGCELDSGWMVVLDTHPGACPEWETNIPGDEPKFVYCEQQTYCHWMHSRGYADTLIIEANLDATQSIGNRCENIARTSSTENIISSSTRENWETSVTVTGSRTDETQGSHNGETPNRITEKTSSISEVSATTMSTELDTSEPGKTTIAHETTDRDDTNTIGIQLITTEGSTDYGSTSQISRSNHRVATSSSMTKESNKGCVAKLKSWANHESDRTGYIQLNGNIVRDISFTQSDNLGFAVVTIPPESCSVSENKFFETYGSQIETFALADFLDAQAESTIILFSSADSFCEQIDWTCQKTTNSRIRNSFAEYGFDLTKIGWRTKFVGVGVKGKQCKSVVSMEGWKQGDSCCPVELEVNLSNITAMTPCQTTSMLHDETTLHEKKSTKQSNKEVTQHTKTTEENSHYKEIFIDEEQEETFDYLPIWLTVGAIGIELVIIVIYFIIHFKTR